MEWIKISWQHEHLIEPFEIYMELNSLRFDIRKIELYKDGSFGYAHDNVEFNGTKLNEQPFPSIEEYNIDGALFEKEWNEKLFAKRITENEFEKIWIKLVG